ncbi:DUF418 domain-containing protein [Nocardiopsis sp. NRRL B-16309]|uniref:DUF418 domain-containing protein n=1 Tax=Nocardiopsis sp. NRRL B-16309 TaxID=1519494 RepID=UPI0006AF146D|nr:DUF418 domain-containing protein [Nocardiopsis sp. NRRL B-16309]KOX16719.1 membrane protein [Nocardiopsis sp. NRRL B-16309]
MTSPTRSGPRGTESSVSGARLPLVDVLRGVAILGTLASNVWLFTAAGGESAMLFETDAMSPMGAFAADPSVDGLARGVFFHVANGKFLAMLTLLFGVGLAIQFRSAARHGARWPGRYAWRALFLFAEGLVHFTLVFAADVLMGYAVVSLLVAWLLTRPIRAQKAVMWAAASLHLAVVALLTAALALRPAAEDPESVGVPPEVVALYAEGSFLEQVAFRLDNALWLRAEPVFSFGLLLFMFLLGARLFRAGAFGADATGRRIRNRMLVWGLGLGVPLNTAVALMGADLFFVDRYVAAPIAALGYIGLVGWLLDRVNPAGAVVTAFSSLGRMAMSGYVMQNVVCVLVCYGFGLGLASGLAGAGPWWVMGLWAAVSAMLLAVATPWLRRFGTGPLEALQKSVLARIPERTREGGAGR